MSKDHAAMGPTMARGLAMTTYRTAEEFAERFDGPASVSEDGVTFLIDAYLEHHGARFSETFVPESFLCLSESIDLHHIDPARIEAKTTLISVDSDTLVPSWQSRRLAKSLTCPTHFHEVSSLYGHDAFLKEVDSIGGIIHNALLSTPEEGGQHVTA